MSVINATAINWAILYRTVVVAIGNPIACFTVLVLDKPGWLIRSGSAFSFSVTGTLAVLVIGYIYIGICAGIRSVWRGNKEFLINALQYTSSMFKVSTAGLLLTLMFILGSDWDVLAFVLGIPILIFLLLYVGLSIRGIFQNESKDKGTTVKD